ncbi:MAG TPA: VWA domain-containing protein, partial [Variovorax sp.]
MNNTVARPLESIAGFAALLREHGMKVGIAEQQAFVEAALRLPVERAARLDPAWRAIACHDVRDWKRWPELFERYWYPQRGLGRSKVSGQTRPARNLRQLVQSLHESLEGGAPRSRPGGSDAALDAPVAFDDTDSGLARAQGGSSRSDALHDRSLAQWLPQDLALLQSLAERIARRLRRRLTRRWHDDAHGGRLDMRRTLRASLRTGGLPVHPVWRAPRREW